MIAKSLLFFHVFLMCFLVASALPLEISAQQTSQIRNLNKNEDYETIQRAINDASVGDVIYVGNGLYNENVVVNKTLSLIGENKFNTIIDGGDSGNVLLITADNVTVTGFTLQNSGLVLTVGGVYIIHSVHNKIIGNVMKNNQYGVFLSYSGGNSITNNTIFNNSYGIDLVSSTDNIITSNNLIYNNHGISLSISISNIFSENNVSSNLVEGVLLSASTNNVFSNNLVMNNTSGFHTISSTHNYFFGNNVSMNGQAFFISASSSNVFSRNNVSFNNYGVVLGASRDNLFSGNRMVDNRNSFRIVTSPNNTIFHNNFINTKADTIQKPHIIESVNSWDNGIEGNYWSRFNETDENEDGIIDAPYVIDEGNMDNCSLKAPYTWFHIVTDTKSYTVDVLCNSTISEFKYLSHEDNRTDSLSFEVSGDTGNVFLRICIPHSLIEPPYTIIANHVTSLHSRIVHSNGTHSWLYFTCYCSEYKPTVISLSSLKQPFWYQLWFWTLIGLAVVVIVLFFLVIKYRRTLKQQEKLIEAYELVLQRKAGNHLKATRASFKTDVTRRKPKIKLFEKKYNLKIRPHDSFEEIIKTAKFKKDRKKKKSS